MTRDAWFGASVFAAERTDRRVFPGMSLRSTTTAQPVLLDEAVEIHAVHSRHAGCLAHVPARGLEELREVTALEGVDDGVLRDAERNREIDAVDRSRRRR